MKCEGHDYCSDHFWHLRRHADHDGMICWGEEGPCECEDCCDRFVEDDEEKPCSVCEAEKGEE